MVVSSLIGKPGLVYCVEVSNKPYIVVQVRQHSEFKLIKDWPETLGRHIGRAISSE